MVTPTLTDAIPGLTQSLAHIRAVASACAATAPGSGSSGTVDYIDFDIRDGRDLAETQWKATIKVARDRESDYGAHNQRSEVTVAVDGLGDDPYPASVAAR